MASATGLRIPTGWWGSAFSVVSQVPGMSRLNVAAQLVGSACAIAGAVTATLPVMVAHATRATRWRALERPAGMGTSSVAGELWTLTPRRRFREDPALR